MSSKLSLDNYSEGSSTRSVARGSVVRLTGDQLKASQFGRLGRFPGPEIYGLLDATEMPVSTLGFGKNGSDGSQS